MILEVGPVKGPKWGVNIEVAVERNGKTWVTEASGHVAKFLWDRGVCAEVVCVQRNVHQHDRAGGSGGNKGKGRNSIN